MQPRRWNEVGSAAGVGAESAHRATIPWSTQQSMEFLTAITGAATEASAALATVERAAEILHATAAVIANDDEIFAAVGHRQGRSPREAFATGLAGDEVATLEVPGLGACAATAMDYPLDARLVVARPDPLTRKAPRASAVAGSAPVRVRA